VPGADLGRELEEEPQQRDASDPCDPVPTAVAGAGASEVQSDDDEQRGVDAGQPAIEVERRQEQNTHRNRGGGKREQRQELRP
jgi:hypothetical protein